MNIFLRIGVKLELRKRNNAMYPSGKALDKHAKEFNLKRRFLETDGALRNRIILKWYKSLGTENMSLNIQEAADGKLTITDSRKRR